ncbi:MAG: hypothetical protein RL215_2455, partial [Planctomycetota bacterium]
MCRTFFHGRDPWSASGTGSFQECSDWRSIGARNQQWQSEHFVGAGVDSGEVKSFEDHDACAVQVVVVGEQGAVEGINAGQVDSDHFDTGFGEEADCVGGHHRNPSRELPGIRPGIGSQQNALRAGGVGRNFKGADQVLSAGVNDECGAAEQQGIERFCGGSIVQKVDWCVAVGAG